MRPRPERTGSLKSGSSMCAKTHSAAPSADELPVASAALLLPFSLKPMDTSCATMSASGSIAAAPVRLRRSCVPIRLPPRAVRFPPRPRSRSRGVRTRRRRSPAWALKRRASAGSSPRRRSTCEPAPRVRAAWSSVWTASPRHPCVEARWSRSRPRSRPRRTRRGTRRKGRLAGSVPCRRPLCVRFVCGVRGLGLLALQLALALHLQLVRGGVHGYLEREHVLPAGDVPNLAGLDALDPFLDFKLKLRRGERNVVAAGPTTRHPIGTRAFRAGHHLQTGAGSIPPRPAAVRC